MPDRLRSKLHRLRGDWQARRGDGAAANEEYAQAAAWGASPNAEENLGRRDAFAGACDLLLRQGELRRLRDELERWQGEFPQDTGGGAWSLAMMRYWMARGQYPQAIAVADDLWTVNAQARGADQILYYRALCEGKIQHPLRAVAALKSIVLDFPHSRWAGKAAEQIRRLERGEELQYEELIFAKSP